MRSATLSKWGNGQGVRLTQETIKEAGFSIGDELEITIADGALTLKPVRRRFVTPPDFEAMFAHYHGEQPREDGFASAQGREAL